MPNVCGKCGKARRDCMCHVDVNLEGYLEEFRKKRAAGKLTEEDVLRGIRNKKPKNKGELLKFLDAIGLNGAARERVVKKVTRNAKNAGRQFLHNLIDDLLPDENDIVIEADCKVECPECGQMVRDLEKHKCTK